VKEDRIMLKVSSQKDKTWLKKTLEALEFNGCAIVTDVLSQEFLIQTKEALYQTRERIQHELGSERLSAAGEMGVLRLMMKYHPYFFRLLEVPELIKIVDSTVSESAVLHLQNGFILPSFPPEETPEVFQNKFHRDVNRVLNGYLASVNVFFAIDEFTKENGATLVVPGTHQQERVPDLDYFKREAIPAECPAGSIILFDSTLWHAAGVNYSGKDRCAINHQFTRSYFKQQIDYARALGDDIMKALKPRTQQLLGWYTRVPSSLDTYYCPPSERLYRAGQG